MVKLPGLLFDIIIIILVGIFYSLGKWESNICNYKPDGEFLELNNVSKRWIDNIQEPYIITELPSILN